MKYKYFLFLLGLILSMSCAPKGSDSKSDTQISPLGNSNSSQLPPVELLGDSVESITPETSTAFTGVTLLQDEAQMVFMNNRPYIAYTFSSAKSGKRELVVKYFDQGKWLKLGDSIQDIYSAKLLTSGSTFYIIYQDASGAIGIKYFVNNSWTDYGKIDLSAVQGVQGISSFSATIANSKFYIFALLRSSKGEAMFHMLVFYPDKHWQWEGQSILLAVPVFSDEQKIFWFNGKIYVGYFDEKRTLSLKVWNDSVEDSPAIWETVKSFENKINNVETITIRLLIDGVHVFLKKYEIQDISGWSSERIEVGKTKIVEEVFTGTEWIERTPIVDVQSKIDKDTDGQFIGSYDKTEVFFKNKSRGVLDRKPTGATAYHVTGGAYTAIPLSYIIGNELFVVYEERFLNKDYQHYTFLRVAKFK